MTTIADNRPHKSPRVMLVGQDVNEVAVQANVCDWRRMINRCVMNLLWDDSVVYFVVVVVAAADADEIHRLGNR